MKNNKIALILLQTLIAFGSHAEVTISDPFYSKQWPMKNSGQVILKNISDLERVQVKGLPGIDINWVDTEKVTTSKKELVVAVIDSGVDVDHPDLKGRIWFNDKICSPDVSTPNRACNGFNFIDNNTILTDDIGHGTHVAGLIAANRNTIGIAGAADSRIKIMPLKFVNSQVTSFTYNGKVITDMIADAMVFAVKNGAEVINLSLGWPKLIDLPKVRKAFELAEENNVIVIAASGNNSKDLPLFPCSYENVICVGAIDNRGELTDFANYGSKVDIVAPGDSIISTYPRMLESRVLRIKNYESKRGSSQASPFVAAAVANLKLLHPGLTNDQVRSLLFRSSRKLPTSNGARFTKFGLLDMKALLDLANEEYTEEGNVAKPFINPQLKSLTEIKFKALDRKFNFVLDLKNLSNKKTSSKVCLKTENTAIVIDQKCYSVNFEVNQKIVSLPITGSIENLSLDSHINFEISIDKNVYQTSLVFSRDLTNDNQLISQSLGRASFEDMGVIAGERRLSRMTRVFDKHKRISYPEYFYQEKLKQTETQTLVSLLTKSGDQFVVKSISLPKVNRVLSIHRQDVNLDGKIDYFIYALSNKKDELLFFLLDEKLNPLFKSHLFWSFKLSTFEGLPIEGGVEKFEWLKIQNTALGTILVPSLYRSYTMPEIDNSKLISERVIGVTPHQFYLNPVENSGRYEIELRVVDSVKTVKILEKKLGISNSFDTKTLLVQKPFPQTENESRQGVIRSLVVVDEDGVGKLSEVTWDATDSQSIKITNLTTESEISQSLQYPIVNSQSGEISADSIFTTLLNRSRAEFLVKKETDIGSMSQLKDSWENPIISLMATFESLTGLTYFVESRSTVTMLRANGAKAVLPVYRDSSFPGQSFSETLTPIIAEGRPGIYINSTLIYGERLYSMIDTESKGFIRPLSLSIAIPAGCIPLLPETLGDKTLVHYTFLCIDSSKEVSMKFLPMSQL